MPRAQKLKFRTARFLLQARNSRERPWIWGTLVEVRNTAGKLGALGKAVVIRGKNHFADLDETLTLAIYDDFPNLALPSMQLRKNGSMEVWLDQNQNREYRIVLRDHEEILCNMRVKICSELWPPFRKLLENQLSRDGESCYRTPDVLVPARRIRN